LVAPNQPEPSSPLSNIGKGRYRGMGKKFNICCMKFGNYPVAKKALSTVFAYTFERPGLIHAPLKMVLLR
jgi:hypothetical protein